MDKKFIVKMKVIVDEEMVEQLGKALGEDITVETLIVDNLADTPVRVDSIEVSD